MRGVWEKRGNRRGGVGRAGEQGGGSCEVSGRGVVCVGEVWGGKGRCVVSGRGVRGVEEASRGVRMAGGVSGWWVGGGVWGGEAVRRNICRHYALLYIFCVVFIVCRFY